MNDQSVLSNVIVCQKTCGHARISLRTAAVGFSRFVLREEGACPVQIVSVGLHCLPFDSYFVISGIVLQSVVYYRVKISVREHCIVTYYKIVLHNKKQFIAFLLFYRKLHGF